jgi:hypothetical protein
VIPLFRPFDAVLTALAVAGSVCLIVILLSSPRTPEAEVWKDGRRILILRTDRPSEWTVDGAVIETGPKGIRVRTSDCPNRYCVRQGWINRSGQTVVCVPKRLTIRMVPKDGGNAVDGVSE